MSSSAAKKHLLAGVLRCCHRPKECVSKAHVDGAEEDDVQRQPEGETGYEECGDTVGHAASVITAIAYVELQGDEGEGLRP